ncbi:type II toxin-antitoxin system VapB family antitoxin [Synechococcus sp. H55.7]|uniref:type II toxin-antitoxin system VapB family antitoxin n=1 Tax=unclassified Synechococcus TaxID=2626047 RepID=UPI0039C49830
MANTAPAAWCWRHGSGWRTAKSRHRIRIRLRSYTQADPHTHQVALDDELIEWARQVTGLKTKREVIHKALRTLAQLHKQAGIRNLRGKQVEMGGRFARATLVCQ